jgi:dimethylaniline monooxygenase (N-oxide forming)
MPDSMLSLSTVLKIDHGLIKTSEYPPFLKQWEFQEFMEDYATHFDLHKDIIFNTTVRNVSRSSDGAKWQVEMEQSGVEEVRQFDKVVLCHGYQTKPDMPEFEGTEKFTGQLIHSQQFRKSVPLRMREP